jgi:hypothetical protein
MIFFFSFFLFLFQNNAGLQRRPTDRAFSRSRSRNGTDMEVSTMELSYSRAPSSLGSAGSEPRSSTLTRRNTEASRPAPLNMDGRSNKGGPASAAPNYGLGIQELERGVYNLNLEQQEYSLADDYTPSVISYSQGGLNRSNSALPRGYGPNSSPPNGSSRGSSNQDLRRMNSSARGLQRDGSMRSNSRGDPYYNGNNDGGWLDDPVYSSIREKVIIIFLFSLYIYIYFF